MEGFPCHRPVKLSVIVPCYNEERTLEACIDRVLDISDKSLSLEIIIIDDRSTDSSPDIAAALAEKHPGIKLITHDQNRGKGAAIRSGIEKASGDFVAVQDADLEYDPQDLKRLLVPLIKNDADVVIGSRFISTDAHRVLYFWHYLGNRLLTLLSNMFTDLNLTDMESCYKLFRRDVIQRIEIKENRFGFEPEIVAKVAHMRLRIYEMGISYRGRTYAEGKKIDAGDGLRALYCIFRYNAHRAPLPVQLMLYLGIGGIAAVVNLVCFSTLTLAEVKMGAAIVFSFIIAAVVNYFLCIAVLFRRRARWNSIAEIVIYLLVVLSVGALDYTITTYLIALNLWPVPAKAVAAALVFIFNFLGRRFLVFPEPGSGDWKAQNP